MKLFESFNLKKITPYLQGSTKEEIIDELISALSDEVEISDFAAIRSAVYERESLMSTNLGNGFAIPHGRCDAIDGMVAVFGRTLVPIKYTEDGNPVQNFFLLVSNSSLAQKHVKLLSKISIIISNDYTLNILTGSECEEDFYSLFNTRQDYRREVAVTV